MASDMNHASYGQNGSTTAYTYPDPSQLSAHHEHFMQAPQSPPATDAKRKTVPSRISKKPDKKVRRVGPKPETEKTAASASQADEGDHKPKRVRTGCLTCRERHLKCDEAWPHCANCTKSNRECKRGVKLNFIDTWAAEPPSLVTAFGTDRWKVEFLDESREIALEYVGGESKYPSTTDERPQVKKIQHSETYQYAAHAAPPSAGTVKSEALPAVSSLGASQVPPPVLNGMFQSQDLTKMTQPLYDMQQHHAPQVSYQPHAHGIGYRSETQQGLPDERRDFLDTAEETLFMQVFVEEVGLWMDSLDPMKHFSRLLPFHALSEPMLLNAFLACGAKHLTLVNEAYSADKALHYYDTATRYLLKNLQNPNRDTVVCATTAVILNVYEVMSERSMQRMNHIAGARALIKECGWNAQSTGIGAACFWLNVGLEVLSCLHFNWQVAWKPEDWGFEMNLSRETQNGMEETWSHRMLYIIGLICQLRATVPKDVLSDRRAEQTRSQQRYEEWSRLKQMSDAWNENIPRTMHPMSYVYPAQTSSKSCFPEIWLVKRTTIVARLFYHTAMLLLAQINPYMSPAGENEMALMQRRHAQMTCGIVAHVKDRGVASVAIRSLAHAAEVLTDRKEQEEVLAIFDKIHKETGWKVGFVYGELKEKWRWHETISPAQYAQTHEAADRAKEARQQHAQAAQNSIDYSSTQSLNSLSTPPRTVASNISPASSNGGATTRKLPSGILNPMYREADFNLPQHPYQNFYVAPTSGFTSVQQGTIW